MFYDKGVIFFSKVWRVCTDFLFPKESRVIELESLSTSEILELLPPAEPLKDKNTTALFDYSNRLVKEMIWELKYGGNRLIAEKFGEILYDVICEDLREKNLFEKWSTPILIPIPMSDKRRFERGWNQTELLAQAIKKCDTRSDLKYLPRQLIKLHHTESQTRTTNKAERTRNIANSMQVLNPASVSGRCVVIIDDVTTTGSTFNEAERVLRALGVKKILFVALAH
ncbi:MAG: phosphoribosyltransferase family protein [Parcubacteria group bacterium]